MLSKMPENLYPWLWLGGSIVVADADDDDDACHVNDLIKGAIVGRKLGV